MFVQIILMTSNPTVLGLFSCPCPCGFSPKREHDFADDFRRGIICPESGSNR